MMQDIDDYESHTDKSRLDKYAAALIEAGYKIHTKIGYGNPKKSIPEIVNEFSSDLVVMGAHGHKGFKDFLFGTTVEAVRHRIKAPLLIVKRK